MNRISKALPRFWTDHPPWLDDLWHSFSGLRAEHVQAHRQGSSYHSKLDQERVSQTKSWLKIPKSRSTQPVIWAHCCTAVSPELLKHDGRGRLTLSTCAGKMYTLINSDVCARLALFWEWTKAGSQTISFMKNSLKEIVSLAGPNYTIYSRRCLQEGPEGLGYWNQRMGNLGFGTFRHEKEQGHLPNSWVKETNEEGLTPGR